MVGPAELVEAVWAIGCAVGTGAVDAGVAGVVATGAGDGAVDAEVLALPHPATAAARHASSTGVVFGRQPGKAKSAFIARCDF